ncbi:MAG: Txe/YoeB family addiction module toxin [Clostridiales bacterium]|nr:Txe/YoeB family addiction module toxin [Clostridiales bacterium]
MYTIKYSKTASKDIAKLKAAHLDKTAKDLIEILKQNPYQMPPRYEKLSGNLSAAYSRRINKQHRLVYEIIEEEKTVKIISLWSHYER